MPRLPLFGSLLVFLILANPLLAAPASQPGVAAQVAQLLRQLDSDSYQEREAAVQAASQLPAEALPPLEAAERSATASPELRAQLQTVLKAIRLRTGKQKRYQALLDFYLSHAGAEYDRVGIKDPEWDAPCKQFLDAFARYSADRMRDPEYDLDPPRFTGAPKGSKCKDPLATLTEFLAGQAFGQGYIDPVITALLASDYSSYTKFNALAWMAGHVEHASADAGRREKAKSYFKQAMEFLPKVLGEEPNIPNEVVLHLTQQLVGTAESLDIDRKAAFDMVDAAMAKSLPEESLVRLNLKGRYLIDYAWDARGDGWANTITEEGGKAFRKRLEQADKVLSRCYELFPDDPMAPTNMINVELGQGQGMQRMQTWFERAMKADPENYQACMYKMTYLAERWYGSPEAQLAFGRECLAQADFDTRIPLIVVTAHANLATPGPLTSEVPWPYYAQADVWHDISTAYDGYLQQHPEKWPRRMWYARYALRAGKRQEALEQYRQIPPGAGSEIQGEMVRVLTADLAMRPDGALPFDPSANLIATARKDTEDFRHLTVDAYDHVGKTDPKWDPAARAALSAAAKLWGNDPDRDFSEPDVMLEQSKLAIDAGCDDLLVKFVHSYSVDNYVTPEVPRVRPTCFDDARRLIKSNYPAFLRLQAVGWAGQLAHRRELNDQERTELRATMDEALPLLTQATKDRSVRDRVFEIGMNDFLRNYIQLGDTWSGVLGVQKAFEGDGIDPAVSRCIATKLRTDRCFLSDFGHANFKPDPAHRDPALGSVEIAREWEPIWQADPSDSYAAEQILAMNRISDRDRVWAEFWTHEALRANPHSYVAAYEGFHQLRWSEEVTFEDLATYADQCAASTDYRSQIPFVLVKFVDGYARQDKENPEQLPSAELMEPFWPKVAAVYEAYLAKFPLDSVRRSEYASYACLIGDWQLAAQQMKILGDHIKPKAFVTQQRLDACRKKIDGLSQHGFLPATTPQP